MSTVKIEYNDGNTSIFKDSEPKLLGTTLQLMFKVEKETTSLIVSIEELKDSLYIPLTSIKQFWILQE